TLLAVVALMLGVIICLIFWKIILKRSLPFFKICLTAVPVVVYTFVVGQISPFLTDRYVMCTYPFWCIMFVCTLFYSVMCLVDGFRLGKFRLSQAWTTRWKIKPISRNTIGICTLVLAAGILMIANNYFRNTPGYLNPGGQETYQVPAGTDCVFIIPDGSYNESAEEISILAQCDNVGVVYESNVGVLAGDYIYEAGDYLLVEIISHLDTEKVLFNVQEALKVTELRELERTYGSNCVRILLGE
ncbi:MAG: hypothetical protein IJZ84_04485, partial [Lachnospiraceae bacterium]|nr:hypothetical protein [Lachnospiraceae bacterium]